MTFSFPKNAVPKSDLLVLMSRFLIVYSPLVVCAVKTAVQNINSKVVMYFILGNFG